MVIEHRCPSCRAILSALGDPCPMVCHLYLKPKARRGTDVPTPEGVIESEHQTPTQGLNIIMTAPSNTKPTPAKAAPPVGTKPAPATAAAKPAANGTKPAAPPTGEKPASAPAAATAPATTVGKESYQKRMAKLPLTKRYSVKILRTGERVTRIAGITSKWENVELATLGDTAVKALDAFATALEKLPVDFKPPRGVRSSTSAPLAVGTKVDLNDQAIKRYENIIEPDDRTGLEVVAVAGNKLKCKTKGGDKLVLTRGQVRVAGAGEEAEDPSVDEDDDSDDEDGDDDEE